MARKEAHEVKVGQLVIMMHGAHSDVEEHYPVRAVKDFEVYEQLNAFVQETGHMHCNTHTDAFIEWLQEKGFVEALEEGLVQYPDLGEYRFDERL